MDTKTDLFKVISKHGYRKGGDIFGKQIAQSSIITRETLAESLVGVKRRLGGHFTLIGEEAGGMVLYGYICPFGKGVRAGCCQVTERVFRRMCLEVDSEATVTVERSIARGGSFCQVLVMLPNHQAACPESLDVQLLQRGS